MRVLSTNQFKLPMILLAFAFTRLDARSPVSKSPLADIAIVTLSPAVRLKVEPASEKGFIIVATQDCLFRIDGQELSLKTGDYKSFAGQQAKMLESIRIPTSLVLIKVLAASQPLTIQTVRMARLQTLEGASNRNATLLLAIGSLRLVDIRDLASEGEQWKSSKPEEIRLHKGGSAWLTPGMHRIVNDSTSAASFVEIEW